MGRHPRDSEKYHPDNYLRDTEDAYVLDRASGIYQPKSYVGGGGESKNDKGGGKSPILVTVTRDRWNIVISVATLLVVAGYTYYAARTVDVLEAGQQRAWVKIETESIDLSGSIEFSLVGDFGIPGQPKDKLAEPPSDEFYPEPYPGIVLDLASFTTTPPLSIKLQNFGNSTARQAAITSTFWVQTDISGDWGSPMNSYWMDFAIDKAKIGFRFSPDRFPIFPGSLQRDVWTTRVTLPIQTHLIIDYSIVVAVAYEDIGEKLHYTAVIYCGPGAQDAFPFHAVNSPPNLKYSPDLWYLPWTQFHACGAYAD
jgi:hypothetical protein